MALFDARYDDCSTLTPPRPDRVCVTEMDPDDPNDYHARFLDPIDALGLRDALSRAIASRYQHLNGLLIPRGEPSNNGTTIRDDEPLYLADEAQVFLCNNWGRLSYAGRVAGCAVDYAGLHATVALDSGDPVPGDIYHGKADVFVRLADVWQQGNIVRLANDPHWPGGSFVGGRMVMGVCLGYNPGGWETWPAVRLARTGDPQESPT